MPSPSQNLLRRKGPTDPYDPYAGVSADDALRQAREALQGASDFMSGIDNSPQVRAAHDRAAAVTNAYRDLQAENARIDTTGGAPMHTRDISLGGGGRNLEDLILNHPGASTPPPEDDRSWLGKAADFFTAPIAPVRRQMEKLSASTEFNRRAAEAGADEIGYSPVSDEVEQLLMGQLSPAGLANVALPFLPGASKAATAIRAGLKAGDVVGAPVEAGRAFSSAREGNYREAGQHAVQSALMGLGAMAPIREHSNVLEGEVLPPEVAPRNRQLAQEGEPDDMEALAELLGLPPAHEPRGLPPRGPLITPPPPEPTWSDSIPPAGSNPPGQARVRTTPRGPFEPAPEVPPSSRPSPLEGDVLPPELQDLISEDRRIPRRGLPPDIDTEAIHYPTFDGEHIDPDLRQLPPAGPIVTPPPSGRTAPLALPPRGPLVTPPPQANEPSFFDRIPPAGQNPRGHAQVRELPRPAQTPTFANAQPESAAQPSGPYRPPRMELMGKRVSSIDADGTVTFADGKSMRVGNDALEAMRAQDPNVPLPAKKPEAAAPTPNPDDIDIEALLAEADRLDAAAGAPAPAKRQPDFDINDVKVTEERGPGYVDRVLGSAAEGAPGLAVEEHPDPMNPQGTRTHVVYRGPDGKPVATAILQRTPEGKLAVGNLAADKNRGMLTGRAMKAISDQLQELDAARPFSGLSPDAEQFVRKLLGERPPRPRRGASASPPATEPAAAPIASPEHVGADDPLAWLEQQLSEHAAAQPREELARAAYTDPLTGAPNRRGLEALEQRAGGDPLHVVGDLRNFKAVNDILGQSRGDDLLRHFSEELGSTLRRGDVSGRIGGDEFALALQGVTPEGRATLQQKLDAATQRTLERFGATHAGEHPIGARFGFGTTREEALAELNRQKELETGPKYRDVHAAAGHGGAPVQLAKPPANPVPGVRYEMPASTIEADPERFQYRQGTDKKGVSAERKIEGKYDPAQGGILGVWKDPENGKTYVVNGHHRLDAAKANNADVGVVYLDAPDAASARAAGAVINLREGNSSMQDAVNFIRDSGMPEGRLRDFGISPRSTIGRDAPAIAGLSDPMRERWLSGDMSDEQAAAIGHARLQPEQQQAVGQLLERQAKAGKTVSGPVLRNLIQQVQRSSSVDLAGTGSQGNIFDMLGDDRTASTALQRAELTDWVQQQLTRDKRLFGYVSKGERAGRLGEAGVANVDVGKAGDLANQSRAISSVFERLEQSTGPISDALNDASARLMKGENPNEVRSELLGAVRAGVEAELRGGGAAAGEVGPRTALSMGRAQPGPLREVGPGAGAPAGRAVEEQPALPGAGQVRDVEHATPTFDAPFALQRETAKGPAEIEQLLGLEPETPPRPAGLTPEQQAERMMTPAAKDERYNAGLDELSKLFEGEQPGRIQRAAERRRAARQGAVSAETSLPGGGQANAGLTPARLARSRQLAQEVANEPPPEVEGRKRTPAELRQVQSQQTQTARAIGKAIDTRDYDEAARLIGEQAERWNRARMREGTGGEKTPPKYERNGEYLASDFAAIHKFLFTPEGRKQLADAGRDLAKLSRSMAANPVIRAAVGGLIGASTGNTTDEQIQRAIAGMVLFAGAPRGAKVLAQAWDHYRRTGRIMRKSPDVPNRDIGYWRAFIAPSTVERSAPDAFAAVRDTMRDLQEFRQRGPKDAAAQEAYGKLARKDMVSFIREEATTARDRGQKNLAARLEATARDLGGELTSGQRAVKTALQHTGLKPNATGREVEKLTQRHIYRIALGYAVDSAAKNLFQPTLALLHVSPRNMMRGFAAARSAAGDRLFQSRELELHRPVEDASEADNLLNQVSGQISDSGRFMRATDNWNRKLVFLGHLAEQGELDNALQGKASNKTLEAAERVVRLTQGEPGALSGNPFLRGPVGGTVKPFTKYPNLVIENMLDAFQGQAKYPKQAVLYMMALGLTGAAFGLNLTDVLIGGARQFGIDPFHPRDVQLPPIAQAGKRIGEYVSGDRRFLGDFIPTSTNPDEVLNSDLAYLVGGRYPVKAAKTLTNIAGSEDPVGDLLSLIGMTSSSRQERLDTRRAAHAFATEARQERSAQTSRSRSAYEKAYKRGDQGALRDIEGRLTPRQLSDFRRRVSQGDLERVRRSIPLDRRAEFDAMFGTALEQERAKRQ